MPVPLKAKDAFTYARRDLRVGDPFNASIKDAELLVKIGRAEYRKPYATRVMTSELLGEKIVPVSVAPVSNLDSMDLEALRDMATRMGVKFHHRAGAAKLRALLAK